MVLFRPPRRFCWTSRFRYYARVVWSPMFSAGCLGLFHTSSKRASTCGVRVGWYTISVVTDLLSWDIYFSQDRRLGGPFNFVDLECCGPSSSLSSRQVLLWGWGGWGWYLKAHQRGILAMLLVRSRWWQIFLSRSKWIKEGILLVYTGTFYAFNGFCAFPILWWWKH